MATLLLASSANLAIAFGVGFGVLALVVVYLFMTAQPPGAEESEAPATLASAAPASTPEPAPEAPQPAPQAPEPEAPEPAPEAPEPAPTASEPEPAAAPAAASAPADGGDDDDDEAAQPWTPSEIADVLSIAVATHNRGSDANAYLEQHFGAGGPNLPDYDVTLHETLIQVLNFWGMVMGGRGEADEALDMFDHALEHADDQVPAARQELLYNRAQARMETTMVQRSVLDVQLPEGALDAMLAAGISPTDTVISTFPEEPDAEAEAAWEASLADFQAAVELGPEDIPSLSQVAMTSFLLATVRPDERRGPHIDAAIAAYERARELSEPEDRQRFEEGLLACAALRDAEAPPA